MTSNLLTFLLGYKLVLERMCPPLRGLYGIVVWTLRDALARSMILTYFEAPAMISVYPCPTIVHFVIVAPYLSRSASITRLSQAGPSIISSHMWSLSTGLCSHCDVNYVRPIFIMVYKFILLLDPFTFLQVPSRIVVTIRLLFFSFFFLSFLFLYTKSHSFSFLPFFLFSPKKQKSGRSNAQG